MSRHTVRIQHPFGGTGEVLASSLQVWLRNGWTVISDVQPVVESTQEVVEDAPDEQEEM